MHLELPKARLHSLKDFLKHYLMIVLSILTALGLEAWIEHTHHEHAARIASAQIEAEIRANLTAIDRARQHDLARAQLLGNVRDALLRDIQAKLPEASIYRHAHELLPDGLYLDVRRPSLRHEAWDVAVANQAASWIDDDRLHRYSAAYAVQDWGIRTMTQNTALVLDGPRMNDAMLDFGSDRMPPPDLLHVINQMANDLSDTAQTLNNVRQGLAAAVDAASSGAHSG
jgi:hypothetical protein